MPASAQHHRSCGTPPARPPQRLLCQAHRHPPHPSKARPPEGAPAGLACTQPACPPACLCGLELHLEVVGRDGHGAAGVAKARARGAAVAGVGVLRAQGSRRRGAMAGCAVGAQGGGFEQAAGEVAGVRMGMQGWGEGCSSAGGRRDAWRRMGRAGAGGQARAAGAGLGSAGGSRAGAYGVVDGLVPLGLGGGGQLQALQAPGGWAGAVGHNRAQRVGIGRRWRRRRRPEQG